MRHLVTWSDIFKGERDSCAKCPVAISLGRSVSPEWCVCIYMRCISYTYRAVISQSMNVVSGPDFAEAVSLDLPEAVNQFIFNFDRGKIDGPISFDLELPHQVTGS